MIDKITNLEQEARKLEPSQEDRKRYLSLITQYTEDLLQHLPEAPANIPPTNEGKGLHDSPINEHPIAMEQAIQLIQDNIDQQALNPASGRYLAYVPGGGVYPAALGDYLAAVANRYSGVYYASPGAVRLENILIRWMCDMVGFPAETSGGNLTSGGSIANLIGIITARDSIQLKSREYEQTVFYVTSQTHHCVRKAIRVAGMADAILREVTMDDRFRMDTYALEKQIEADRLAGLKPFMVIGSAGTTDVGAVDPLEAIAQIAQKYKLWFHVDAAYGGFFLLTQLGQSIIKGIEQADSVVIDPHKGLFLPYGSGVVLVKHLKKLYESQHTTANYMQDTYDVDEYSPADLSPELSRHFRGLRMWLPLKLLGVTPFKAALEEKIHLCRYFYQALQQLEGFELGPYPELSITFFRYTATQEDLNLFNQKLALAIQQDGRVFLSSTLIDNQYYLRMAILNFRTHKADIDLALQIIQEKVFLVLKSIGDGQ